MISGRSTGLGVRSLDSHPVWLTLCVIMDKSLFLPYTQWVSWARDVKFFLAQRVYGSILPCTQLNFLGIWNLEVRQPRLGHVPMPRSLRGLEQDKWMIPTQGQEGDGLTLCHEHEWPSFLNWNPAPLKCIWSHSFPSAHIPLNPMTCPLHWKIHLPGPRSIKRGERVRERAHLSVPLFPKCSWSSFGQCHSGMWAVTLLSVPTAVDKNRSCQA